MATNARPEGSQKRADVDSLTLLGMSAGLRRAVGRAMARPSGLIIASGPGSSATTATLRTHWQVRWLDAICDRATAGHATDAAELGLVIATCDEPDAISVLIALRRMAQDRFALAATLRLVIAQRLSPRLCGGCKRPEQAFGSMAALLGLDPGTILWTPDGCEECDGTGRRGTVGVFEGVEIDPAMRKLLYDGADAPLLARHAFLTAPNFASAARTLAREGVIAAEDAVRVARA